MMNNGEVIHLIGQLGRGGAEAQLLALAIALKKKGWKQTVVSFWRGGVRLGTFEEEGFEVISLLPDVFKVRRLWLLWRLIAKKRPCILHSWSSHTNVYAWLCTRVTRTPWIASLRENPLIDVYSGRPLKRIRYSYAYRSASYVLSNSHQAMNALRSNGVHLKHSLVIPNIIHAYGRANAGEEVSSPVIIAVGSLKPLKAYHVLLEALSYARQSGRSFKLLLAGLGPELERLQEMAEELSLTPYVRFLGDVEDAQELMSEAHICVHPSLSEGLSNTVLEAMAEGLPVVACEVGGNVELITHGVNGLLCPTNDPAALSRAITGLLDHSCERERLGKAALEFVRRDMQVDKVTNAVEAVYTQVFSELRA